MWCRGFAQVAWISSQVCDNTSLDTSIRDLLLCGCSLLTANILIPKL